MCRDIDAFKKQKQKEKEKIGISYLIVIIIAYHIIVLAFGILYQNTHLILLFPMELILFYFLFAINFFSDEKGIWTNPLIMTYMVVICIPVHFVLNNYRQVQFYNHTKPLQTITGKMNLTILCNKRKSSRYAPVFSETLDKMDCEDSKEDKSFYLQSDNNKEFIFYAGYNFAKKANIKNNIDYEILYRKFSVKYSTYILFLQLFNMKSNKNIVYGINNTNGVIIHNEDYFKKIYKKQKNKYILFSLLFLINGTAFFLSVRYIHKNYLVEYKQTIY